MTNRTTRTRHLVRVATLLMVLAGWLAAPRVFRHWVERTALAAPMTFVVNTAADADDGLCSTAASGCTLREAINAANANSGPDTINFNIPGAGVKTIKLTSKLPALASPVTIDGYTQGVATPNTLADGDNALLLIELNGTQVDNDVALSLFAGDSTVRGLIIEGFSFGITIGPGGSNTVEGCFIGTNPDGDGPGAYNGSGGSNGRGVSISSANNTIGGTTPATRNIISGNSIGVLITNGAAIGNKVQNNYIGADASGSKPISNKEGVVIANASNDTIGGTVLSAGNLIAFNDGNGINLDQTSNGNSILGNSIHSNTRLGINLGAEGVTANDTGDADTGANTLQNFPVLTSASSIGANTTIHGTLNSKPNTQFRVEIFSSRSCDDSGNGEGQKLMDSGTLVTNAAGDLGFASVIPTASLAGPYITATATDPLNNTSEFSLCVTALGSSFTVNSIADTDDGSCTLAAGGCTLREAINAANSNADANNIKFDIPGSGVRTITPLSQLPTIAEPVIIDGYTQTGASSNTLAEGDNATLLIELNGASAGNAIGLNIQSGSSVVRGLIINRFTSQSILLLSSSDNVIAGNFLGTDQSGSSDLGNGTGILITNGSNLNRIGGLVPADRNIISGNNQAGIRIQSSDTNVVWGNYIGTNASGTAAIGNATGIDLNSHFYNRIGGTAPQARNVISGNTVGLLLDGSSASNNRVQGNYIGTDASGTKALGNSGPGISIGSLQITSGNLIGVDVFGGDNDEGSNVIAFNGGDGIFAAQGVSNAIFGNNIHSNGGLGIDLAPDGVTANDANDGDSGVNNLQNFPIPSAATVTNNQITVSYSLNSKPNETFVVNLYSSATCDPSGHGEGEHATGFTEAVTTNLAGMATSTAGPFNANLGGKFITLTATDSAGNTSEFSPCLQAPFVSTFQFGTPSVTTVEDCDEVVFTVSRIGDTSSAASVDYATQSGTASDRTDFTATRGTLQFAPGETAMTISVLISEDSFTEGAETATITLSNLSGAGLGNPSTATLQILDDPPESSVNPNDLAEEFVCQHYHDFLNRQHDVGGLNFWTNEIESCGANLQCREGKRVSVSAAFFLSIEFQETGFFAIRVHRVAFGERSEIAASRITYDQFIRDARTLGDGVIVLQPGYEQKLEQNRQTYAEQIVGSAAFISKYPLTLTADQYIDAVFASAGVVPTPTERQDGIIAFGAGGTAGRVAALRKAADSASLRSAEFRSAFVLMQYFGYLRRNPTDPPDGSDNGYQFWLAKLNTFNGDFVKAEMVRAFIISTEYRSRFGQP